MKSGKRLPNYIFIVVIASVSFTTLMIIATPKLSVSEKLQQTKQLAEIPKVISQVKDLEVISTTIKRQGESDAVVAIEIRNNSDKPIIAIAIESGDKKDASGVSADGFRGEDQTPSIILPPHGTIVMEMPVSNLLPGKPLKVAGVMYLDGTEDGDELTRKTLREHKDKAKTNSPVKEWRLPQ